MRKLLSFLLLTPLAWATTWNSDGSQADVNAIIAAGTTVSGDIVTIPAGSFTWGTAGLATNVNKVITLQGAGPTTIITLAADAPSGTSATIRISAAATVKDFAVVPVANRATFNVSGAGFRITGITYNSAAASIVAYFAYINKVYGVIDGCTITGGGGTNELIFVVGPDNSWQTPSTIGAAGNVFIEGNTFNGVGYVCDANNNARAVVRYNTVTGAMKVDGHGANTNSVRGVRHMEVYGNHWTSTAGFWNAIEIRGGTGMFFYNTSDYRGGVSVVIPEYELLEYGYIAPGTTFGSIFQTLEDYPIDDQIGVGEDPKTAASEPAYTWYNRTGVVSPGVQEWTLTVGTPSVASGNTDSAGYAIGATVITLTDWDSDVTIPAGNQIAYTVTGTVYYADLAVSKNTSSLTMTLASPGLPVAIPASATEIRAGAQVRYEYQTGIPGDTFTAEEIIEEGRDYYLGPYGGSFPSTSSVGLGTTAEMNASSPTATGQGWWVTDQGNWNTDEPADSSGLLYRWNGAAWVLFYTPYTYPFDAAPSVPVLNSATVNSAGTTLTLVFSESCTTGGGGDGGVSVSASGGTATLGSPTGSGSTTYVFSVSNRVISGGESITVSYTQPGNGIESTSDQIDVASFSNQPVTNNSTVNNAQAATLRGGTVGGGF